MILPKSVPRIFKFTNYFFCSILPNSAESGVKISESFLWRKLPHINPYIYKTPFDSMILNLKKNKKIKKRALAGRFFDVLIRPHTAVCVSIRTAFYLPAPLKIETEKSRSKKFVQIPQLSNFYKKMGKKAEKKSCRWQFPHFFCLNKITKKMRIFCHDNSQTKWIFVLFFLHFGGKIFFGNFLAEIFFGFGTRFLLANFLDFFPKLRIFFERIFGIVPFSLS